MIIANNTAADRWFGMSDRGSESDNKHLLWNAYRIPEVNPPIASDLIDHTRLCARDLVELNRAAIERLAIELDHRSEIDGDEAARILGGVERPPYRQIRWNWAANATTETPQSALRPWMELVATAKARGPHNLHTAHEPDRRYAGGLARPPGYSLSSKQFCSSAQLVCPIWLWSRLSQSFVVAQFDAH